MLKANLFFILLGVVFIILAVSTGWVISPFLFLAGLSCILAIVAVDLFLLFLRVIVFFFGM